MRVIAAGMEEKAGKFNLDRLELDEAFSALEQEGAPAKRNPWEGF